jgi:AraC-like DNA-binding protein
MEFRCHIPKGPLREFVDAIHFLSGKEIGTGIAFPRMNQVIIINLGSSFTVSPVYADRNRYGGTTNTAVWMNGKQDEPFMLENAGTTAMYTIGLKLGMVPFFADLPALETSNQALAAENWAPRDIFTLRDRLLACPDLSSGFLLIEQYLEGLLKHKDLSSLHRVTWMAKAMHTQSVEEICHSLGMTRKRLRTESHQYFGGAVKNIQGIIRLNKTLETIATTSEGTLSSLHEYFDQSHFIRDFKARTGITPLQYRRLCRQFPFIAWTPNFLALTSETFLQCISAQGS